MNFKASVFRTSCSIKLSPTFCPDPLSNGLLAMCPTCTVNSISYRAALLNFGSWRSWHEICTTKFSTLTFS